MAVISRWFDVPSLIKKYEPQTSSVCQRLVPNTTSCRDTYLPSQFPTNAKSSSPGGVSPDRFICFPPNNSLRTTKSSDEVEIFNDRDSLCFSLMAVVLAGFCQIYQIRIAPFEPVVSQFRRNREILTRGPVQSPGRLEIVAHKRVSLRLCRHADAVVVGEPFEAEAVRISDLAIRRRKDRSPLVQHSIRGLAAVSECCGHR